MTGRGRTVAYVKLLAVLVCGRWLVAGATCRGNAEFHTLSETIARFLGLTAGAIALARYYARKSPMYLPLGVGFVGAAVLDGYHAAVTFLVLCHWNS